MFSSSPLNSQNQGPSIDTALYREMRVLILDFLSVGELIRTTSLVNKEWKALSEESETHRSFAFPDIQFEDVEETQYVNEQWQAFVAFIEKQGFSDLKKRRILSKARAAFEIGVVHLDVFFKSISATIPFSYRQWITAPYMPENFFAYLLLQPPVSSQLKDASEIKALFFLFKDDGEDNLMIQALKSDTLTSQGDTKFVDYLFKNKPESIETVDMEEVFAYLLNPRQPLSLFKHLVEKFSTHYDIDTVEESLLHHVFKNDVDSWRDYFEFLRNK